MKIMFSKEFIKLHDLCIDAHNGYMAKYNEFFPKYKAEFIAAHRRSPMAFLFRWNDEKIFSEYRSGWFCDWNLDDIYGMRREARRYDKMATNIRTAIDNDAASITFDNNEIEMITNATCKAYDQLVYTPYNGS